MLGRVSNESLFFGGLLAWSPICCVDLHTHIFVWFILCLRLDRHTFSHELGHNFGARHSRFDPVDIQHEYGHGYRDPNLQYRTVMTYDCPNGGCMRVPYFSSDRVTLTSGLPLGTPTENNARLLSENAPGMAELFTG